MAKGMHCDSKLDASKVFVASPIYTALAFSAAANVSSVSAVSVASPVSSTSAFSAAASAFFAAAAH
jgi:hypothetical protein